MRGQPTKQINAAQFVLMSKPWRTATITASKLQTANTRSIGCPSKEFVSANGTSYVDLYQFYVKLHRIDRYSGGVSYGSSFADRD